MNPEINFDEKTQERFDQLDQLVFWVASDDLKQSVVKWACSVNLPNLNAINYCIERILWGHPLPFKIEYSYGGVGIEL